MKKRVLVVENYFDNLEMVGNQLRFIGYDVILAVDGVEGVEKAASELPDVIIMDMLMPKMDGYEATKLIRQDPRTRDIPILASTGKAMPGDMEKCLAAGCNGYISKPFTHRQLGEALDSLLRKRATKS